MRWNPQILQKYDSDIKIEEEQEASEGVKEDEATQ